MAIFLVLMIIIISPNDLFSISFLVADQSWAAANQKISKNLKEWSHEGLLRQLFSKWTDRPFIPRWLIYGPPKLRASEREEEKPTNWSSWQQVPYRSEFDHRSISVETTSKFNDEALAMVYFRGDEKKMPCVFIIRVIMICRAENTKQHVLGRISVTTWF